MKAVLPLLLAASVALAACGDSKKTDSAPAVARAAPVRATAVVSVAVAQQTRAVGVLAPRDEVRLAFKWGGVVEQVGVDSGDIVRKGQLLASLKQAEVDASVVQAEEALAKARRDLERARQLRADEVATEEQVQDLTTAYNVARSGLETARFNARFARIEAPADGVVFERLVEAGELVQPGQPVVVVGATGSGWVVRVGLADRDAVRVEAGSPAQVTFDAFPGRTFNGKITRIGAAADRLTGTFEIEVEVEPGNVRFARGLVGRVTVPLAKLPAVTSAATIVPVTAIVDANGPRASVFVLDTEHSVARRKQVTVGPLIGEQIVVASGLTSGEQVITDGATWLTDGRAVRVVDADRG